MPSWAALLHGSALPASHPLCLGPLPLMRARRAAEPLPVLLIGLVGSGVSGGAVPEPALPSVPVPAPVSAGHSPPHPGGQLAAGGVPAVVSAGQGGCSPSPRELTLPGPGYPDTALRTAALPGIAGGLCLGPVGALFPQLWPGLGLSLWADPTCNGTFLHLDTQGCYPGPCPEDSCTPPFEFQACGSPCAGLCATHLNRQLCQDLPPCQPGCYCPKGLLEQAGGCIPPEQCNCWHTSAEGARVTLAPGDRLQLGCKEW
ncbi:hypothetical protein P7K49_025892 [Saguinus oedipus]|uniref:TIL domain-containing protein n=1 Tax=Saguinus oedipus TaxID=9490 RepID=A0ABQ9UIG4_SAGOE|nr:hypothetical protein P7K49_025892 [Saguinus oedipus]